MDWNTYFMGIAHSVALKSKDPNTKVGAVIVDSGNRIISTGYNGFLPNFPDNEENWSRPRKYDLVIHAELNAVLYARQPMDGCAVYCTLQPCKDCTKALLASGIKNIFYSESRHDKIAEELINNSDAKSKFLRYENGTLRY